MFRLHPKLEADTHFVADLPLCRVLLMNNAHYPWLILVPRAEGCRELFDVPPADQSTLWAEIRTCHEALRKLAGAEKMNVGALGNMVPQLHIHIIARNSGDAAWPNPVWGGPAQPYAQGAAEDLAGRLRTALSMTGVDTHTAIA